MASSALQCNKQTPNWCFWPGVYVIGLIFLQAGGFTVVADGFDCRLPTALSTSEKKMPVDNSIFYHNFIVAQSHP
jgi:hypothetical protein